MKIFLAAPITQTLDPRTGIVEPSLKDALHSIIVTLEDEGHSVYSAHRREKWGRELFSPREALAVDLKWISDSDLLLAVLGSPPSPGVQLEIGYALGIGRRIVVLIREGDFVPYLLRDIAEDIPIQVIKYRSLRNISRQVRRALRLIIQRSGCAQRTLV